MSQPDLFPDAKALKSRLFQKRRDFDSLFEGFEGLRAVSYVVSPTVLLDLFDRFGFARVEMVVGDNLADSYRQELAQKGADATLRLAALVESGKLRILVPERTQHTKLYLLDRPDLSRVILTSANLTETARAASKQLNYAWYADLPPGHPWLERVEADYKAHADLCSPFLGDLAELMRKNDEGRRRELVEAWLKNVPAEEVEKETRKLLTEIARLSIEKAQAGESLLSVSLPEAPVARRQLERYLAPLEGTASGKELRLDGGRFLHYVQETHGVPVLQVDVEARQVRLAIDGKVEALTEPVPDAAAVDAALAHVERYLDSVDLGQAPDPHLAKVSIYEALLFMLSAPFANEYMRLKRRRYGIIDSRGPRFLYIYGPSHNGKSTFLRFALRLLAGRGIEPLSGGEFTKRKIVGAASVGTSFPLVFDDLVLATRPALFEEVLKSYWESWWSEEGVSPQLVLSSNAYSLKDWARSRVKRLDFDVQFSPGGPGKDALAEAFRRENRLFRWFSTLYFERLGSAPDDELDPARRVFEELYRRAGRPLPAYFPKEPIEKLFDPGRELWRDLVYRLRKARVERESDRATVHFSDDMLPHEVRECVNSLPPFVKHKKRGKALVIETPAPFHAWLDGGVAKKSLWERLLRR